MQYFTVETFWKWFAENSDKLHSGSYEDDALKVVDETITAWGLSWEIGPGNINAHSITISPNGNPELVGIANNIIRSAPFLKDWEFYVFKQPKENWHLVILPDENITIDASGWMYVLLEYPDRKKEIVIKADNLESFDTATQRFIVDLVLTNLLGEEQKMQVLDFIELQISEEYENQLRSLHLLTERLQKITS